MVSRTSLVTSARRRAGFLAMAIACALPGLGAQPLAAADAFHRGLVEISIPATRDILWSYKLKGSARELPIAPPVFEVDGKPITAVLSRVHPSSVPITLNNGTTEYSYEGGIAGNPELSLRILFRVSEDNPIVRFCYILRSAKLHCLTKSSGKSGLVYLRASLAGFPQAGEIHLSSFVELTHSYTLDGIPLDQRQFQDGLEVMGPLLVGSDGHASSLLAYEHGSQVPNAFLEFQLKPDCSFTLGAVKGNYLNGQPLDVNHSYQTLWMDTGMVSGNLDQLASAFRAFVLRHMTQNLATRRPYIFYNTWNFQERNKWWKGRKYLDSMNEQRILEEIDVAHRMGIEVFVLDTGWYARTGDWPVSLERFPDGLKEVKAKLDGYGMKLGLWFGPTSAAATSMAYLENKDCVRSWHGEQGKPYPVWETEESYPMCLVSRYSDAFAEQLIHLAKDVGVTYFKWDAIGQYGCDSPNHWHGNASNSPEERADAYAFRIVQQMSRIIDKVAEACPDAIVDFDITESGRAVGLAFLSSGKYFLINNGPYYMDYDIPFDRDNLNWNIFVHKGSARTWICRLPLPFDKWIPSILFLTHYLPDDPVELQEVNVASLVLGQNGIWGDLLGVSDAGIQIHRQHAGPL